MKKSVSLALYALIALAFAASGQIKEVPASADLYVDFEGIKVYNSDLLRCSTSYAEDLFRNITLIQFDISELNLSDEDVGILVLKAASVEMGNAAGKSEIEGFAGIALLPIGSSWNESSSTQGLLSSLQPSLQNISKKGLSSGQLNFCLDQDRIIAFDVSESLKEVKGGRVSFLLMAASSRDYAVEFFSRQSAEGPHLIAMPYPEKAQPGTLVAAKG
jgi:hypothetical protein